VLEPLIRVIASRVRGLDYRQARAGVTTFAGTLDAERGTSRPTSSSSTCSTSA
jgi:hypothetical protein